jgi:hypothetical protein
MWIIADLPTALWWQSYPQKRRLKFREITSLPRPPSRKEKNLSCELNLPECKVCIPSAIPHFLI